MTNLLALSVGTVLVGDYKIQRVLGAGGFGITYLAEELALARQVTIKEYFPSDFAIREGSVEATPRSLNCAGDYRWGLDRFIEEAQTLAKFDHPNIVRVYRYFRANNTGYIVLQFEEGTSFKGWLKGLGRAPRQGELDQLVIPMLDALETIHRSDFLHRDIAPDNIIVRRDNTPVLIDFGSARGDIAKHSKTVSALVKPGYSPYEQYATTSRQQGPWSDIYSLGATLYQAVAGKRPQDAPSRMVTDELIPARDAALSSYRSGFLAAIDTALALDVDARPRSVADWRRLLLADMPVPAAAGPAAPSPIAAAAPQPGDTRRIETEAPPLPPVRRPLPQAPRRGRLRDLLAGRRAKTEARRELEAKPAIVPPPSPTPAASAGSGRREVPPRRTALRRNVRSLAIKLLVGLGVASVAVGLQDYWPQTSLRASGIVARPTIEASLAKELKGHRGAVTALAFTEDGKALVSSSVDGTLRAWNSASGAMIRQLETPGAAANAVSVQGKRAAAGYRDGQVILWDMERGQRLAQFKRNGAEIWSVALVGDADRIAAAGHDWVVALWDPRSDREPKGLLEGHESAVQAIAVAPGGGLLASGSADQTVKLWNLEDNTLVRTYRGHGDFVTAVALSSDGRMLASAGLDGTIRLWSTRSRHRIHTLRGHRGRVSSLAFSPDMGLLASAGQDGAVRVWDVRRGRTSRLVTLQVADTRALAFSPDGRRLAAGSEDGVVRLWDPAALPLSKE